MKTKVKINLKEGLIELEGSEVFVSKYLDIYKVQLSDYEKGRVENDEKKQPENKPKAKAKKKQSEAKKQSKSSKTKNITAEKFNIHGDDDTPSLEEFFKEKSPGRTTGDRIAVIGYYIQYIKKQEFFTEGNIDFAYRMLKLTGRPKHLYQIMINNKNQKDLFEQLEGEGQWVLTRTGEIFVEEKLPEKK